VKRLFSLVVCSLLVSVTAFAEDPKLVMKVGSVAPEGTPWSDWLDGVKARLEKDSGNRVKLKLFLGGKLGGEKEMAEETRNGNLGMFGGSAGALATYVPELAGIELPYLYASDAEADYVLDKIRPQVAKLLEAKGFVMVMWGENGWHGYGIKGKCVEKPDDMKVLPPPSHLLGFMPSREEARRSVGPVARGTVMGFLVGLLPGGGAVLASFLSYGMERKLSKHPEEFGKGAVEGLAGPESANNAGTAGAFVPLLCMGIPANAVTALLLGAFIIHGVTPGPTILERQPEIFWGVVASMYIGNIMLLILNLPLIGLFVRILDIPRAYLTPMILAVCLIGVYSSNCNPADVVIAVIFGFIGYGLRRHGFDLGIVILAYVLGPIFERSVRQSLAISDGDPMIFLHSYLSAGFAIVAVALLIAGLWPKRKKAAG